MAGGYIYLLIDGTNDFEYVGQTTRSVEVRFKEHLREKTCIGKAMRAHGAYMFVVAVLKKCDTNEELDRWEKHFILSCGTKRPNGYNCTDGGDGTSGHLQSVETRAKIRAANKGKKVSAATCAKISEANTGKKRSDEERTKLAKMNRHNSPFKNLIREMEKLTLSYGDFAKILGLSKSVVAAKMRGKIKFTAKDAVKLAEFFGKPAEYLLKRDDGLPAITSKAENCLKMSLARRANSPFKNLLAEMDKRYLSYNGLAKLLGLSQPAISAKMREKMRFTARDKAKLVEFFGKPAEYLFAT